VPNENPIFVEGKTVNQKMLALFALTLFAPSLFSETDPTPAEEETQLIAEPEALPDKTEIEAVSLLSDDQKAFLKDLEENLDDIPAYLEKLKVEAITRFPDYLEKFRRLKCEYDFSLDLREQHNEFEYSVLMLIAYASNNVRLLLEIRDVLTYFFYKIDLLKHPEIRFPTRIEHSNTPHSQYVAISEVHRMLKQNSKMTREDEKFEAARLKNRIKIFTSKTKRHVKEHSEAYAILASVPLALTSVVLLNKLFPSTIKANFSPELIKGCAACGATYLFGYALGIEKSR
jgi:hypothetical protein